MVEYGEGQEGGFGLFGRGVCVFTGPKKRSLARNAAPLPNPNPTKQRSNFALIFFANTRRTKQLLLHFLSECPFVMYLALPECSPDKPGLLYTKLVRGDG